METRDLVGYGPSPPRVVWPGGAKVAVNFVLNYEEGSEYAFEHGDGRSETALTEVAAARVPPGERDLAAESMYEYGARAGVWRIARAFASRKLPLTLFGCALALERNPAVIELMRAQSWDVCCHGYRWIEHFRLDEPAEREQIALAVASLRRSLGQAPLGWYCRYGPSLNTRRLLLEHGSFLYDSDSYADDLPFWTQAQGRAHLVVPYSLVTNDTKMLSASMTARTFFEFLRDAFETLREEGHETPRMMSVGMHARIVGHPARMAAIARFLDHVSSSGDAWICRRSDIAQHWIAQFPAPSVR